MLTYFVKCQKPSNWRGIFFSGWRWASTGPRSTNAFLYHQRQESNRNGDKQRRKRASLGLSGYLPWAKPHRFLLEGLAFSASHSEFRHSSYRRDHGSRVGRCDFGKSKPSEVPKGVPAPIWFLLAFSEIVYRNDKLFTFLLKDFSNRRNESRMRMSS